MSNAKRGSKRRDNARKGAKARWKTQVLDREKNGKIRYLPYCLRGLDGLISDCE